ncbi:hypothetical protein NB311A_18481 [Nitrobacter sp. Nb-311A]|nr:hypothetical protein NB311A_18481 [Nitrobacter sp. Nb-311A]
MREFRDFADGVVIFAEKRDECVSPAGSHRNRA